MVPEGTLGTGTAADPYMLCQCAPITFQSQGVNPNLGYINPGLVFLIYPGGQPTETNPEEDFNSSLVAFPNDEDGLIIVDNGTGNLCATGFPEVVTFPITVAIVPILVPDISDPGNFDVDCTSINPDYEYPVITFYDPAVNPECAGGVTPDCIAEAGIVGNSNSDICQGAGWLGVESEFGLSVSDQQTDAEYGYWFVLTTEDGTTILENSESGDMTMTNADGSPFDGGEYCVYGISYLLADGLDLSAGSLGSITNSEGQTIADGACIDLSDCDGGIRYWANPVITATVGECNGETVDITVTVESATWNDFTVFFNGESTPASNEDILVYTVSAIDATQYIISAMDGSDAGCSTTIEVITPDCVDAPECIAEAGIPQPLLDTYCSASTFNTVTSGFTAELGYEQVYVLKDTNGVIIEINQSGIFTPSSGTYTWSGINVEAEGVFSENIEQWVGSTILNILEQSMIECYNVVSLANTITILPEIETEVMLFEDCANGQYVIDITILSGSDSTYTILDTEVALGGNITTAVEPNTFFSTVVLGTSTGCGAFVEETIPACEVVSLCEAGTLVLPDTMTYCETDTVVVSSIDFNDTEGYVQAYIALDPVSGLIVAANVEGVFNLPAGNYIIIAINGVDGELIVNSWIGVGLPDILGTLSCFDLAEADQMLIVENCVFVCEANVGVFVTEENPAEIQAGDTLCVPDFLTSQEPTVITPDFDFIDKLISTCESTFGCGVEISDDLASFEYLPLPALTNFVDSVTVIGCDSLGVCDTVVYFMNVGCIATDYCNGDTLQINTINFNDSTDYTQVYFLIDSTSMAVVEANTTGTFLLETGGYTTAALNTLTTELPTNLDTWDSQTLDEIVASLECVDWAVSENILVDACTIEPTCEAEVGELIQGVVVNNLCTVDTINFTFEGYNMDYAQIYILEENGQIFSITTDNSFQDLVVGNYVVSAINIAPEEVPTDLNDWLGQFTSDLLDNLECYESQLIVTVNITECIDDCEADAGVIESDKEYYCAGETPVFTLTGFNETADYFQSIVIANLDGIIVAVNPANITLLPFTTYEACAVNLPIEFAGLLNTGQSITEITDLFPCISISDPIFVTLLQPLEISADYECDELTGVATIAYSFIGGLPQYVAENGSTGIGGDAFYTVEGDVQGNYTYGENILVENIDNTTYSVSVEDQTTCSNTLTGTPTACIKTAIELINFNGYTMSTANQLYWSTASETNNSHFLIERSKDGMNFETIGNVAGQTNSNHQQNYEFTDVITAEKTYYYRLKTVDIDGKATHSHVIELTRQTADFTVVLSPNPVKEELTIQYDSNTENELILLEIFDITGKRILQKEVQNTAKIDTRQWTQGIYFIKATQNEETYIQRILKE